MTEFPFLCCWARTFGLDTSGAGACGDGVCPKPQCCLAYASCVRRGYQASSWSVKEEEKGGGGLSMFCDGWQTDGQIHR